ncbi:hypothetical protein L596_018603 [Steinernema carpocapsae]|uniref:R3H domain-containing protein n=1 Tax=Steinernema carpocapsae TaxID=34508 RepID=A0A4U5N544_STECR|nr:hypothetical protein L596_018603 [Steinernema carpocapsae]
MMPKDIKSMSLDGNGKKKQLMRSNAMCGDDDNRLQTPNPSTQRKMSSNASSLSSAPDFTDTTGINLLNFFKNTLHKSPKDRQLLLEFEKNLIDFAQTDKQAYRFPSMCSYNRMLLHRVAAYFGLDHNVDQTGKAIVVNKTDHSRMPTDDFRSMIRHDNFTDIARIPKRGMQSFDDPRGISCANGFYLGNDFASRRARSFEIPELGTSPLLYQQPAMTGSQYSVCSNGSSAAYVSSNVLQIVPQDLNESVSSNEATASLASPPIMESPAFAYYQRQQYANQMAASFGSPVSYPMTFGDGMMFSPPTSNAMATSPPCQWSNADGGYGTSEQSVGSAPDTQIAAYRPAVYQKFPDGSMYFYPTQQVAPPQSPQPMFYPPTTPDQLAQQINEVRLTNSSSSSEVAAGGDAPLAPPQCAPPVAVQHMNPGPPSYTPTPGYSVTTPIATVIGTPDMCYTSAPMFYRYYQQTPNVMYPVANGYGGYPQSANDQQQSTSNGNQCENGASHSFEGRPEDPQAASVAPNGTSADSTTTQKKRD